MKKVLIVTYYWPPAGGPGVQRWLKFVTYLPKFGIEPILFIPENPSYPLEDASLLPEVPEGIQIFREKIWEPYVLAEIFSKKKTKQISSGIINKRDKQSPLQKLMLYVRGNFFIPDARKFWVKPAVKSLKKILTEEEAIETLITTGPPHSVHLIGLKLKQWKHNLRWLADFRDPWTQIGYHKKLKLNLKSRNKHQKLELEVLRHADEIITTSFTTKEEFKAKTKQPISVITNGFDSKIENHQNAVKQSQKFTISHIGSLLSGRNPENLWQVLAEIIEENTNFAQDFQLNLVGAVSSEILESLKKFNLYKFAKIPGYVSHNKAISFQKKSNLLLLIEIDSAETRGIIPGKFFEYMAAKCPILAIGPQNWDVQSLLEETSTGSYFSYTAQANLKDFILEHYTNFKENREWPYHPQIEKYSREQLTSKLAQLLKN